MIQESHSFTHASVIDKILPHNVLNDKNNLEI